MPLMVTRNCKPYNVFRFENIRSIINFYETQDFRYDNNDVM